jgi:hypothetical protein
MGREAKLLLALLGLLTGALVGVVSVKLLVPRPPVGAGPDIHGDLGSREVQELVEPPALSLPSHANDRAEIAVTPTRRFDPVAADTLEDPLASGTPPVRDPFVAPASFEPAATDSFTPADALLPALAESQSAQAARAAPPPTDLLPPPRFVTASPLTAASPHVRSATGAAEYVSQSRDSWWSLAERTYGDGRLYRALFAWNRARDPRISLVAGTHLELPPLEQLAAAWPALMPAE